MVLRGLAFGAVISVAAAQAAWSAPNVHCIPVGGHPAIHRKVAHRPHPPVLGAVAHHASRPVHHHPKPHLVKTGAHMAPGRPKPPPIMPFEMVNLPAVPAHLQCERTTGVDASSLAPPDVIDRAPPVDDDGLIIPPDFGPLKPPKFKPPEEPPPFGPPMDVRPPAAPLPLVTGVPEPSTWAMFILGMFAVGGALRRRRRMRDERQAPETFRSALS